MKIFIIVWQTKYGSNDYAVFNKHSDAQKFQKYIEKKIKKQRTNCVMLISKQLNDYRMLKLIKEV